MVPLLVLPQSMLRASSKHLHVRKSQTFTVSFIASGSLHAAETHAGVILGGKPHGL